ncbi:MAG: glycoside hydrolase family 3 C-terminal domain-containing protein, partial [Kiritimatiellae bacterium]|nr:glycoside hydrolase family 3 C-terminal domain-containing protein [Kiritimatiellia bacterium]
VIAAVAAAAGPAVRVVDEWNDGDTAIVCLGITSEEEGEEGCGSDNKSGDRAHYGISEGQLDILRKCRTKDCRVKRVVSVVFGGSAFDLKPVVELSDAVIVAWYPGEAGGEAIARTIFGQSNPSGRLPVTFPKSYDDLPAFTDYSLAGRTYRYATKAPAYPFGYGLSYTKFAYSGLETACADGSVRVKATVENVGKTAGEEVVQLYLRAPAQAGDRRLHHLEGFKRVKLAPGERAAVEFTLARGQFEVFREDGTSFVPPGRTTVFVGGGQPGFADVLSADVLFPFE